MQLTEQELEKLAVFLHKRVGIVLQKQKLLRFSRKIEEVINRHNFNDFGSFYHTVRFHKNEALIQELINAVTVNETYFWREHEQFEILAKEILPRYVHVGITPTVRILVSPCSSGEEVYSIMLAVLQENDLLEHLNIEIIGIDIDSEMISQAQKGLYKKRSIEKLPKHILQRYFTQVGAYYQIDASLRESATFMQANIFDATLEKRLGHFDILFSRNMLIYFNKADKQRAFVAFHKLLKDGGYLFLGHADANELDKTRFVAFNGSRHIYKKI